MKNAIALISNDWHLKRSNIDDILELFYEKCQLAVKLNLKTIICLGDVFESRISQRMDVLIAFSLILKICEEHGLILVCIPGNHDKTDYYSEISFLSPWKFHPNLKLIESYDVLEFADYRFHFIPYFAEDDKYINYLNQVRYKGKDLLFSHVAVQGSVNNDGTTIDNRLTLELFKKFVGVFLGHYHNHQCLGKNFYHLPSIQQNNFGEDQNKGFTILYDDLSIEIVKNSSKRYCTEVIDLDKISPKALETIANGYNPQKEHVRLIFKGSEEKLKGIDTSTYDERGFVIKKNSTSISVNTSTIGSKDLVQYDMEHMIKFLKIFCEQRDLSYPVGLQYLKEAINEDSFLLSSVKNDHQIRKV